MIENIRKYSGLMIVIFVILFISFFFMDTGSRPALGGGGTALRIDGRSYSYQEVERLGANAYRLTGSLAQVGDFSLYQFLTAMVGDATSAEQASDNFFVSRMLLREARDEFGLHPSDDDVSTFIRTMRAFAGPDGAFDNQAYRNFVENYLGRQGMTESDLRDLAEDILVSRRLGDVIGAGLGVDRDVVAANMALDNQQITAISAKLTIDAYEARIDPTEDEVREYWEIIQDSFKTPLRRQFTYILADPQLPELPDEEPADEEPADGDEEAREAARLEREAKRAAAAAEIAEERRRKQLEADAAVDDFLHQLEQRKGAEFEELAAEQGWEVHATGMFAASEPPAELDLELRATTRGGRAADELFAMSLTSDPFSRISDAIPVEGNRWVVARLDEEEPPRTKTFEEARDEAREQYIREKATEAMRTAGEEVIAKINEALAAGTPFAEAAREAGLSEVREIEDVTRFHRPEGESEPQNLFEAARGAEPGSVMDLIVEDGRAFVVYVAKREVVRDENFADRLDAEVRSRTAQNETIAFMSWLNDRMAAANIDAPGRRF